MKEIIRRIPLLRKLARGIYRYLIYPLLPFPGSAEFWIRRYRTGGNSGAGSYNELAGFKAEILNSFVKEFNIKTVIEFGCGDGNQLSLAEYPSYIGFEISPDAITRCKILFSGDNSKTFKLMSEYKGELAELALALDVIYHLIEDTVFADYMGKLFSSSCRFVVIYSSNTDTNKRNQARHIKNRRFTDWIEKNQPDWRLFRHIPNRYPFKENFSTESWSEFYVYEKS